MWMGCRTELSGSKKIVWWAGMGEGWEEREEDVYPELKLAAGDASLREGWGRGERGYPAGQPAPASELHYRSPPPPRPQGCEEREKFITNESRFGLKTSYIVRCDFSRVIKIIPIFYGHIICLILSN